MKILIVNDPEVNLITIRQLQQHFGKNISIVSNNHEILEIMKSRKNLNTALATSLISALYAPKNIFEVKIEKEKSLENFNEPITIDKIDHPNDVFLTSKHKCPKDYGQSIQKRKKY